MRRLFILLVALGLLSPMVGCHHICGNCDCNHGCGCFCGGGDYPVFTPMLWTAGSPSAEDAIPVAHQVLPQAGNADAIRPVAALEDGR